MNQKTKFISFSSQTVSDFSSECKTEMENANKTTATPKTTLTRSTTYHGVPFTVPHEQINVEVDETNVEVKRTILHTQPLTDILDDLPDTIKEIVAGTLKQ